MALRDTKTRGRARARVVSLDAPSRQGGTLLDRLPDRRAPIPGLSPQADANAGDTLDVLAEVLEASIGVATPGVLNGGLRTFFAASITAERTRELLQLVYKNGGDRVLPYLFGLGEDGRQIRRRSFAPLDVPARVLWPASPARSKTHGHSSIESGLSYARTFLWLLEVATLTVSSLCCSDSGWRVGERV
jgi:hypothetical protein